MNNSNLRDAFQVLTNEAKDLFLPASIPETFGIPSALEFVRDSVAKNLPLIMREAINDWPAVEKWNSKYFRETLVDKEVTVAITPNGYADGLALHEEEEYFVLPLEQSMCMGDFLDALDQKHPDAIPYIQRQNSNLTEDFQELWMDVNESSLDFASEAFNKKPDAINFWMGDERAITSMHKDPYENIYCVISGYKDFILIPPIDLHNVPRRHYPMGIYMQENDDKIVIEPILDEIGKPRLIEWVSVDPLAPDLERFPCYADATTYEIRLNAGDLLYLPSLWYHHVRQSHKCIAVNFWYDMEYDARYCFYRMMEKLCNYGQ
ncbi:bifunctional peptidase and (3S)-lysyl hydroxylase Jmjd7 isoform X1 [Anopheles stephensi]|uniref:bifunctional peptidase and (3S)-lysyl hydroxylase Jmjd7 isoform X1 n=1 Tax=Anopheles stephensi TaxID=30069 RepID=UPI001658ACC8|nr:bifunctional peptidase and (3S)-lysyl hydroxylase Jmjd7 isoform X1 [Anopheles stephensi]